MLVLKHRIGQSIIIGDNIQVTVTRVQPDGVTLGFTAPKDVHIVRSEEPDEKSAEERGFEPVKRILR